MAFVDSGSSIKLTSRFYDYPGGPLIDPDSGPELDITFGGTSILDNIFVYPGDIVRESTGIYSYTYTVPVDAELGNYTAKWLANEDGEALHGEEVFTVTSVSEGGTSDVFLGEDFEINYVAVLEPAFLDPDEVLAIFPEADATQALEAIHRASLEVQAWIPNATADSLSPLLHEYIFASVACDLSQRYGYAGESEYDSMTLGDLSVANSTQGSGNKVDRGMAKTWCEIAAALRKEVKYSLAPMKGVVRGSRLLNPIPRRSIYKNKEKHYGHLQGTLDDVKRPPSRF